MPSKRAMELEQKISEYVGDGASVLDPAHIQRLINDAAGPLVEILEEAHDALGDYRYNGFNIRIEKLLAEWAVGEGGNDGG